MISLAFRSLREPISRQLLGHGLTSFRLPILVVSLSFLVPGCADIPNQRVADCHKLAQSLQTDNSRLKDVALRLRTENQDLTQRSIDDGKKLKTLADGNDRLSRSVVAYQDERERMAKQVQAITHEARSVGFDPDDTVRKAETNQDAPRSASRTDP